MSHSVLLLATLGLCLLISACGGDSGSSAPDGDNSATLCHDDAGGVNWPALLSDDCPQLSDYGLFADPGNPRLAPTPPGLAYAPATALFTDYAVKYRFVFIPPGEKARYVDDELLALPVGTVLVKSFALPQDSDSPWPQEMIETRLLIHRDNGWVGLPYVWNDAKTEAELRVAGAQLPRQLSHNHATLNLNYQVPDRTQCKICHQRDDGDHSAITPIGPKARLLNWSYAYSDRQANQLDSWRQAGLLENLPPDLNSIDRVPAYDDVGADLTARAKGYLDINCAHCHNPRGFASISGLRLEYWRDETSSAYGICKQPPGYDGGAAGLSFDIVPGDGAHSILPYRMSQLSAKDKMPPLGRQLVHEDGVALIRAWIDSLPAQTCD